MTENSLVESIGKDCLIDYFITFWSFGLQLQDHYDNLLSHILEFLKICQKDSLSKDKSRSHDTSVSMNTSVLLSDTIDNIKEEEEAYHHVNEANIQNSMIQFEHEHTLKLEALKGEQQDKLSRNNEEIMRLLEQQKQMNRDLQKALSEKEEILQVDEMKMQKMRTEAEVQRKRNEELQFIAHRSEANFKRQK